MDSAERATSRFGHQQTLRGIAKSHCTEVEHCTELPRVPLSTADRLTLAVLGTFAFFLILACLFGTPPEIHP
jgi:hypothetical protein